MSEAEEEEEEEEEEEGGNKGDPFARVWLGSEFGFVDADDRDACNKYGALLSEKLCAAVGVEVAKERVVVEREGDEQDDFWDLFDLG